MENDDGRMVLDEKSFFTLNFLFKDDIHVCSAFYFCSILELFPLPRLCSAFQIYEPTLRLRHAQEALIRLNITRHKIHWMFRAAGPPRISAYTSFEKQPQGLRAHIIRTLTRLV